jgi:hypothetical protein
MARRAFFSFHYERDIWRASIVRNSWITKPNRESAGFFDASLWEEAKRNGQNAIRNLILNGLQNTSVSVILIGSETSSRDWVNFEIIESYKRGNGLLGVYIHNIRNEYSFIDIKGINPFNNIYINLNGQNLFFSSIFPTYDYILNDGYNQLGNWIEDAASKAGK